MLQIKQSQKLYTKDLNFYKKSLTLNNKKKFWARNFPQTKENRLMESRKEKVKFLFLFFFHKNKESQPVVVNFSSSLCTVCVFLKKLFERFLNYAFQHCK